ncbi:MULTISPECIES: ATPase, T2SS/T4P/T4SS family [unclassified Variovorax]|uniref:GspE/PulE family protein n=1 Tax=unclassified Variovorax TaxID=663243 RepID=UPI002577D865|nr:MULTISPECIES: ATPase, T2SS/T4P/T4SS family [unclassified Variovorax]MDM0090789.1 ATPase, T2SS/T4P/T4SS family [Variovorax sp. J22G40]MDM0149209.1 ATPase, T2SS/T4P/T4SS family [Variovorax sp. J2P1-31]
MTTLKPLEWEPPKKAAAAESAEAEGFLWPRPPGAAYPPPSVQTEPLPCEIRGTNGQHAAGRMTFFIPDQAVALVQLPRARTTVPLRFDQFRSITLTTPLVPLATPAVDPQSGVPREPASAAVRVIMKDGTERQSRTVGHVESPFGLFLFPPAGEDGGVLREFLPRSAFARFEVDAPSDDSDPAQALATPLLSRIVTTGGELVEALQHQARMPMVRIGEALISLGMVSADDLRDALAHQQKDRGVPLGELLVRRGVVSRADLQVALTRKMGYPLVDLDVFVPEPEALRKIAYAAAQRLQVMPLMMSEGRLVVALDDPANRRAAVDEVEFIAQMKVAPVLAQCRDMERSLHAAYEKIGAASDSRFSQALRPIEFEPGDTTALVESLEKEGEDRVDEDAPIEQSDNSLVKLINRMILEAHSGGVSDIHIESYPGREKIRIRFRKDGLLRTYLELPSNYRNAMIARIKIMCDLDISERRKPQDGKINFAKFSPQHRIELRVATIPTNSGLEDVVMRILASAKPIALDRLGLSELNLERLRHAVERPYGMVLCVGPTGSGKTTTLHSALSHINVPERKIWTAEDPIEITQPGLRQVQVNPRIDWTFAKALRAFLRADPDVIMVGEIRDEETAKMAVEASLTGHLVLSTLHTNSAPETVTRLLDMGMDPFNFADSLLAVLAQRLVRRLCTHCRTNRDATDAEIEELMGDYLRAYGEAEQPPETSEEVLARWTARHGQNGRLQMYASPGCSFCDQTGFKGRAGLHELMVISRELRHLVQTGARAEALQATALREGMRTLRQDGIDKVLAGQTTIEEVRSTSNV